MKAFFITLGVIIFLGIGLAIGALLYIGLVGPETFVVAGGQMKKHQTRVVKEMGLLAEGEKIMYFYSDALADIRKGMYFVTPVKLVLHCEDWEQPQLVAPYHMIRATAMERNESFFEDSYISVVLADEETWAFPVSSERGMDKLFFEYIRSRVESADES